MKIIISPAKKMRIDNDSFETSTPYFLRESATILNELQKMDFEALKSLWKCNDDIASLNMQRLKRMDLEKNLTPALIAYEGLQYQHMSPSVFSSDALEYLKNRLFILSGFYGVLRAFDGVTPYRLEMQAKLRIAERKNLYEFWGDKLYRYLIFDSYQNDDMLSKMMNDGIDKENLNRNKERKQDEETNQNSNIEVSQASSIKENRILDVKKSQGSSTKENRILDVKRSQSSSLIGNSNTTERIIINLASKEYSQIIEKYIQPEDFFITIEFGELIDGKVKQKGTLAKMARGEMVRFMAENQVEDAEKIKEFHTLDFRFSQEFSTANRYIFIKES